MKMAELTEFRGEKEEMELDLGFSIGRSFRTPARPSSTAEESWFPGESPTTYSENQSPATDLKKKRKKRNDEAEYDQPKAVDRNLIGGRDSSPPCRTSPIIRYLPMTAINGFMFPRVMPWTEPYSGAGNISVGSPVRSSSAVADNQSCSNEGTVSNQSLAEHESNGSINDSDHSLIHSSRKLAVSGDRKVAGTKTGSLSLASMPCVSTMGEGPESKRIIGFLHRYSKSEVSIVCVCHGKSFSPAEFVKHAGGRAVANPLRHITVIPSAFA